MRKKSHTIKISQEAIDLLKEYDLTPEDLTASELREVEKEMAMRRADEMYLDGVQYYLLPFIRERKLLKELDSSTRD